MRPFFNPRLTALAGLFVALGLIYNVTIPLFEAPDEQDHVEYANWLADGNGLPHLVTDRGEVGEIWQPPLYYALIGALVAPIDRVDLAAVAPLSGDWLAGLSRVAHYHTSAEAYPYRGAALAVHVARIASTVMGLITILATYAIARRLIPRHALPAAALVALNPQFIFMSAAVNNDNLVITLCSVALWILIKLIYEADEKKSEGRQAAWFGMLGLVWGSAGLTKLTGLTLGLPIGLTLLYLAWRRRSWRPLLVGGIVAGGVMLLVCGWWFWRNWQLYGDPLAWGEMLAVTGALVRPELLSWPETLNYAGFLRFSYWAAFGYGVSAPGAFYTMTGAIMALGVAGWALVAARRPWRDVSPARFTLLILLVWSLTVSVFLLRWMRQIDATNQGRLLFPAIAALSVLLAVGLAALDGRRLWLARAVTVVLGCWAAAMPLLVIAPAYAKPGPVDAAAIANPLDVRFGEDIRLLGYELPAVAEPGQPLGVALYWEADQALETSYVVAVRVLDPTGRPVSGSDTLPAGGRYSTVIWEPGRPFRDSYQLPPVAADAVPGRGTLLVTVYPRGESDKPLAVSVAGVAVGNEARLGTIKLPPITTVTAEPARMSGATFDSRFRLLGFNAPESAAAGDAFPITLYWEAAAPDGRDYTVFIHLLNEAGELVAQSDGQPGAGTYPTSIWAGGERVVDEHVLTLSPDLAAGEYTLLVGLYDRESGMRLPALGPDGSRYPNDAADLATVTIGD